MRASRKPQRKRPRTSRVWIMAGVSRSIALLRRFRHDRAASGNRVMNRALWILQGLLAALFLFTGGTKLVLPIEEMTKQVPLPGLFLRFIGVAEVLGAIGLILPGLLHIQPGLTPLAAAGLVIIMIGATVLTLAKVSAVMALFPLVVGLL